MLVCHPASSGAKLPGAKPSPILFNVPQGRPPMALIHISGNAGAKAKPLLAKIPVDTVMMARFAVTRPCCVWAVT